MIDIALKRICGRCNRNLIDYNERYCKDCEGKVEKDKAEANRQYDKHTRYSDNNKQYAEFYRSKAWTKLREHVLMYYNYIDVYEYYINNRIVSANTVHHVLEIKSAWNKRLEFGNMFPCCLETHNKIHKLYAKDIEGTQRLLIKLLEEYKKEFKF